MTDNRTICGTMKEEMQKSKTTGELKRKIFQNYLKQKKQEQSEEIKIKVKTRTTK